MIGTNGEPERNQESVRSARPQVHPHQDDRSQPSPAEHQSMQKHYKEEARRDLRLAEQKPNESTGPLSSWSPQDWGDNVLDPKNVGFEPKPAFENLALIRTQTYKGVSEWRIEYAEKLFKELHLNLSSLSQEVEEAKEEEVDDEETLEMIKKISISSDRSKTPERSKEENEKSKLEMNPVE
eukprot:CAMPEP_0168335228 /NCGR_PEP_ID=MMETSP0213-20121227/10777_1 /TAXON_ID=151035 /ORGANISM="Euplotes harpa, Strain FSP1.4" /LENGTH=180 /DNA_ID=CAMNT_0008340101 /DNA_START=237 /DNA_END=780 /DNA_ORIENTATION=-